jgi:hypothetical protein
MLFEKLQWFYIELSVGNSCDKLHNTAEITPGEQVGGTEAKS